jgi:hypothetical protein
MTHYDKKGGSAGGSRRAGPAGARDERARTVQIAGERDATQAPSSGRGASVGTARRDGGAVSARAHAMIDSGLSARG